MPAIAQISVNFTSNAVTRNPSIAQFSNTVVSPFTLSQYLLYNRERSEIDFGLVNTGDVLKYDGGFISAGDKINYKHSDFQIRQNLDIEKGLYVDNIYANRISTTDYRNKKTDVDNARQINISPNPNDASTNYIRINTNTNSRVISLLSNFGVAGENSFILNNTGDNKNIILTTNTFTVKSPTTSIEGALVTNNTVTTTGVLTVNNNVRTSGNLSVGTTSYDKFVVFGTTGNTAISGRLTVSEFTTLNNNLYIKSSGVNTFTVDNNTGDTDIKGTLAVTSDVTAKNNVTVKDNLYIEKKVGIGKQYTTDPLNPVVTPSSPTGVLQIFGTSGTQDSMGPSGVTKDQNPEFRISDNTGTQFLDFHVSARENDYNLGVEDNDKTIIFSNGSIDTGNLFIGPWSTNGYGIRIRNDGYVNIGGTLKVDKIENLDDPVQPKDAANKRYVDAFEIPPGAIMAFWRSSTPGWLLCNGSAIPAGAQYDALRSLIGANVPDLQGMFIRGLDTRGAATRLDPDAPRNPGSYQGHATQRITGKFRLGGTEGFQTWDGPFYPDGPNGSPGAGHNPSNYSPTVNFDSQRSIPSSSETRPKNRAFNYFIKY